jgi:hypothetical protein
LVLIDPPPVADQPKDSTHTLTTALARKYGTAVVETVVVETVVVETVVVEDLFVAGMVRSHDPARQLGGLLGGPDPPAAGAHDGRGTGRRAAAAGASPSTGGPPPVRAAVALAR